MRLPDFFVVGAAKAGTTALHHYLGQHPDLYLHPFQEPSFFAFEREKPSFKGPPGIEPSVNRGAITDLDAYADLFVDARKDQCVGDISPVYLYWPGTAQNIRAWVPDARICVILRHPVDRAYSSFMHAHREGREPISDFECALEAENERIRQGFAFLWRYGDMGMYAPQLRHYYEHFPREQVKVVLYDDLIVDPSSVCQQLQGFIGADSAFTPDASVRHNVSGIPRSRWLHRALDRPPEAIATIARTAVPETGRDYVRRIQAKLRTRNLRRIPLDPQRRLALTERFHADILETQELVRRDLTHWLEA